MTPLIRDVLRKPVPHGGMERPGDGAIKLVGGLGIEGDCHASPIGPRQVLVAAQETLDDFAVTADALRANVVVEGLAVDDAPSGSVLALGDDARVRLTFRCEVCRALGPHLSPARMRAIAGRRGYLGVVVAGGTVRLGDAAHLEPPAYEPVPDSVFDRFCWLAERIPPDRVVIYRDALLLMGAAPNYARALPNYARRANEAGLPSDRVVPAAAAAGRRRWDGAGLFTGYLVPAVPATGFRSGT